MLGDLDELVLRCRNEQARSHIGEAVRSYKAAAYRSAIIMTWVALAYDLVDKLRELALNGDAAATKRIDEYDRIHRENDLGASLKFEKSLLDSARKEFELISDSELIDLARIQEDRNRCAHPSLNMDGEAFSPSAELARTHVRAAIEYVLQNEPAQGKHALEMVMRQVNGEYFPRGVKKIAEALSHGPLLKGRKSLVRSFIVVLIKSLLRESPSSVVRSRYYDCLHFVKSKRPEIWEEYFASEFAQIAGRLDIETHGAALLGLVGEFPSSWGALPAGVAASLDLLVRGLPTADITLLVPLSDVGQLERAVDVRIKILTPAEAGEFLFYNIPAVWHRIVRALCNSDSFAEANAWAKEFCEAQVFQELLSEEESGQICDAVVKNRQLRDSKGRDMVLSTISRVGHRGEKWDWMIAQTGLNPDEFIPF